LALIGPNDGFLDSTPGLDGWDIMVGKARRSADVWLEADRILYVTEFLDAAVELAGLAKEINGVAAMRRAMASVLEIDPKADSPAELAGCLARQIVVQLLRAKVADQTLLSSAA